MEAETKPAAKADGNFLDEHYPDREETARRLGCTPRTLAKYEKEPDGLPFVLWAGKKRYPWAEVPTWLERRVSRPNPRRAGRK